LPGSESKTSTHGLYRHGDRARDFVNAGASSIWAKMDLARRFDRICHRASKHHLANRTRLATWVLLHGVAQSHKNVVLTSWEFFAQQITLMNPATFPLWFGGLIWLLASREGRRYRVIAFTYLIALAEFIVMHGKNY